MTAPSHVTINGQIFIIFLFVQCQLLIQPSSLTFSLGDFSNFFDFYTFYYLFHEVYESLIFRLNSFTTTFVRTFSLALLKLLGVVALGSRIFAEDSPPTYWDDAWPAEYNNDTNQLMLSYLISKWHFERNYFQHHFYDIKNLWPSQRTFFALGPGPET